MNFHIIRLAGLLTLSAIWSSAAIAQQGMMMCGDIRNAYGPYDYTNARHREEYLPIVEQFHFDVGIESLKGRVGIENSFATVGGDIEYTLRAFPNHHRALYAMVRYNLESVPKGEAKMSFTVECWFDRAKRFAPHDAMVIMLEGLYFQKIDRLDDAITAYERALQMQPDSPEINYNAGLLYTDLKQYDRALELARRAYELGYPLPGLRNKLKRRGVWTD